MDFRDIFHQILSDQNMNYIFGMIVLVLTGAILFTFMIYLIRLIFKVREGFEILKRLGAVFFSLMVFLIATTLKLSIPNVLFKSIELANPAFYGINMIAPAFIGYFLSLYIMSQLKRASKQKDDHLIHRWIIFIFSLSFLVSISILYVAFKSDPNQSYSLLLVNGIFITALLYNPIFKRRKIDDGSEESDSILKKLFRAVFNTAKGESKP